MNTISNLYQTTITASNYNIDINDTNIPVTIKLTDFNGNPVKQKYISSITISNGVFSDDSTLTNGTTNNNGEVSLTFTPTDWGIVTISANNQKIQFHVDGWQKFTPAISTAHSYSQYTSVTFYKKKNLCVVYAYIDVTANMDNTNNDIMWYVCTVPSECRPSSRIFSSQYTHVTTTNGIARGYLTIREGDDETIMSNFDIVLLKTSTYKQPEVRERFTYIIE